MNETPADPITNALTSTLLDRVREVRTEVQDMIKTLDDFLADPEPEDENEGEWTATRDDLDQAEGNLQDAEERLADLPS